MRHSLGIEAGLLALIVLVWAGAGAAAPNETVIKGVTGTAVLGGDPTGSLAGGGRADGDLVTEIVAVEGMGFAKALRITTRRKPDVEYLLQVAARTAAAVRKGDVLLLTFHMRPIRTESPYKRVKLGPCFERGGPPHTKSLDLRWPMPPDGQWHEVRIPFVCREDYPAGGASFNFRAGYEPQVVELGGLSLLNFGPKLKPSDLPRTKQPGYPGGEPDAPWRAEADKRIEKLRKGDLTVSVADAAGKPVPDAAVAAEMTRNAFGFGTAVNHRLLMDEGGGGHRDKYRAAIRELFNKAVIENGLKWGEWAWENPDSRKVTLDAIRWLREQGIEVRGHCILWPSWGHTPKRLRALAGDKPALRAEIDKHITEVVTASKGTLTEWDVVNEAVTNHDVMDVLGGQEMVEWFKRAHEADPACQLYLNDYSLLSGSHVPGVERWARLLVDGGAPLGGIGIQGHLQAGSVPPQQMLDVLDRLAKLGRPLQVTELDCFTGDDQLQADYLRDVLTVMFSHPAVEGVIMWGFWDGAHWKKNALLYHADWTARPALAVYRKLVFGDWWTRAAGKTDDSGRCRLRGFRGRYKLTVTRGGRSATAEAEVTGDPTAVKIVLKDKD